MRIRKEQIGSASVFMQNGSFSVQQYEKYCVEHGLEKAWDRIISVLTRTDYETFNSGFFDFDKLGGLYEIGLAATNKISKKHLGQYFTPSDVSALMSHFLIDGETIDCMADVACGCGNLIIEALKIIKSRSVDEFYKALNHLYCYDQDSLALRICKARIECFFGIKMPSGAHFISGDFLSSSRTLPANAFVISNPPYSKITEFHDDWANEPILESKDLYVGFVEKITKHCKKAVIITPQSYLVGSSFSCLRRNLYDRGGGNIYVFDNVPGTIFEGKKAGIFNSNTANGVRAAILEFISQPHLGFRITHLIRFKSAEREKVLSVDYLRAKLGTVRQDLSLPLKCRVELESFVYPILQNNLPLADLLSFEPNDQYSLFVNTSARYFIVATKTPLDRSGFFEIYAKNEQSFWILYALLNSSYCYLWWRMRDGGILISKSLLESIPVPSSFALSKGALSIACSMFQHETDYFVYKKNGGKMQQSVKFPETLREELNQSLFGATPFFLIHKNSEE